jgi:hypothetical protein
MNEEKNVVQLDSFVKFFGIITAVVAGVFAIYLHFMTLISDLEDRIEEMEKQRIKDEHYMKFAEENKIELQNMQSDMRSMNETITEIIRSLRYKGIQPDER